MSTVLYHESPTVAERRIFICVLPSLFVFTLACFFASCIELFLKFSFVLLELEACILANFLFQRSKAPSLIQHQLVLAFTHGTIVKCPACDLGKVRRTVSTDRMPDAIVLLSLLVQSPAHNTACSDSHATTNCSCAFQCNPCWHCHNALMVRRSATPLTAAATVTAEHALPIPSSAFTARRYFL